MEDPARHTKSVGIRIEFWGDEVERIMVVDPLTGELLGEREDIEIYPAKHFVTSQEKMLNLAVKEHRGGTGAVRHRHLQRRRASFWRRSGWSQRTRYDLEMMQETGYCAGVENYSRHLWRAAPPGSKSRTR